MNFSSIDNYEIMYAEDNDSTYESTNVNNNKQNKITKKDIENIPRAKYTNDHNNKDKDYKDKLKINTAIAAMYPACDNMSKTYSVKEKKILQMIKFFLQKFALFIRKCLD